ncbi:hypothetical protein LXL04_018613 [Taraxacum kok-saghyz]
MALIDSQNLIKAHDLKFFTSDQYELAVNQSIQSLLDSLQKPSPDLSAFTSTFLELMQAKPNPLLETIWVFSGLTCHTNNSQKDDILDQVTAAKALFQSITASSASCSSSICIALIAPVIFKLYSLIVESKKKEADSKRGKKARREITKFLDVILGYFNVCCDGSNGDEDSILVRPLTDLISIWVHPEATGNESKQFFPLLSDEIINWVTDESHGALELLAGAVITEAVFLKLCLKLSDGSSREELQNDLKTWTVCSITGFHNFYFFGKYPSTFLSSNLYPLSCELKSLLRILFYIISDILIKMLLEPKLTLTFLLNSEEESFLKKLLYDAVILPDYSFLHLDKLTHLPINHIKSNILARIMVTHEAIELFRKNNDHSKAICYTNAFSSSHLPKLTTKLVTSQLGNHGKISQPNGLSPMAFLKWMLELEGQGLSFCDGFMSNHREKLVLYSSRSVDFGQPSGEMDEDLVFFIDNKGNDENEDEKVDDLMNDVFVKAAYDMRSDVKGSGKKRKEIGGERDKNGVKFQRHEVISGSDASSASEKEDSGSGSEVEDPDSDDDDELSE